MNIEDILSEIDGEIARLEQAKALLAGAGNSVPQVKRGPGRPRLSAPAATTTASSAKAARRRTMSPEGRAKIAAAQRARWAKARKTSSTATKKRPGRPAKKGASAKKSESSAQA